MWFLIAQTESSYSRSRASETSESTAYGQEPETPCGQIIDWMSDCGFPGRSKHNSVTDPDCVQHAKNPISYHSHPCRVL
jgi:hypothetical protein